MQDDGRKVTSAADCRGDAQRGWDAVVARVVERGLAGSPLEDQIDAFCSDVEATGFPLRRANMSIGTLHPRYGAQSYVWRAHSLTVDRFPRERTAEQLDAFRRSPIYRMRATGERALRRLLGGHEALEFPVLEELRAEGMTEYAARLVSFGDSRPTEGGAAGTSAADPTPERLEGVFFSCATDAPGGFDDRELDRLRSALEHLALAVKARSTFDVASTLLATYLGHDAGRRVLTGEIDRGSVRSIPAVIWLCDLRGFTPVAGAAKHDLVPILDDYLEVLAAPVHRHAGQILKFLGDGFLAIFELSAQGEEAVCRRALSAARALRRGFPTFNARRRQAGMTVMDFGLALHRGDVLYGNIGTPDRLDFTVIGAAVNEASRIESLCRVLDRPVLISSEFRRAARAAGEGMRSVGFHALRGVPEPQELFTLSD